MHHRTTRLLITTLALAASAAASTGHAGTDAGDAVRSGKAAVLDDLGLAGCGHPARAPFIELDAIVSRLSPGTRRLMELGRAWP